VALSAYMVIDQPRQKRFVVHILQLKNKQNILFHSSHQGQQASQSLSNWKTQRRKIQILSGLFRLKNAGWVTNSRISKYGFKKTSWQPCIIIFSRITSLLTKAAWLTRKIAVLLTQCHTHNSLLSVLPAQLQGTGVEQIGDFCNPNPVQNFHW